MLCQGLLLLSFFFIKMIFFEKIQYFVPSLMLLLILIFWNIFVNLFFNFAEINLPIISEIIDIKPKGSLLNNRFYTHYEFHLKPEYRHVTYKELKEYTEMWFILLKIHSYSESHFNEYKKQINPYITIICSLLYLVAGFYKLWYIFLM